MVKSQVMVGKETNMTDQDIIFKPIVWLFVQQYHNAEDTHIKKKLKEALKDTLKKMTDQPVNMVSESVMKMCKAADIDPFELLWTKRNILGRDQDGKSLLLWEHTTPLAEFFESLIKCTSIESISETIEKYSGVCWITRDEDNLLNKKGFRSKRVGGWQNAYSDCGIKIIKLK